MIGTAYSQALTAIGIDVAGIAWSMMVGRTAGGLTLGASTGLMGGTPAVAGTFSFNVLQ